MGRIGQTGPNLGLREYYKTHHSWCRGFKWPRGLRNSERTRERYYLSLSHENEQGQQQEQEVVV